LNVQITWSDGGTATLESLEGDRVTLVSSRAFAPGSRPEGTLEGLPAGALEPEGRRIWVKVHGSRRQDDGSFRVAGRLLNPTRELRQFLKEAALGPIGGKNSTP
jgi:hypothetical protein